ncbi:DNA repair exonuclease [Candidatus Woesearchaeota archaeon]|nr:DNA repair exonuclease [Candidatus Woesearchaeota archaeon]
MVRIAHLADLHLGSWRDPDLKLLGIEALRKAVDDILSHGVEFVIIAGDLFHTALPSIDIVKEAVRQLKRLRDNGIAIYAVPGSHDYSPTGKTMLEVLEESGLLTIVSRAEDTNNGLRLREYRHGVFSLYGMPGRALGLEKSYYKELVQPALQEDRINIFVMHSGILELLPKQLSMLEAVSISDLPRGFDYYASGHIHRPGVHNLKGYLIGFPGPLMPDNFQELEELGIGGYYLIYINEEGKGERFVVNNKEIYVEYRPIMVKNVITISIDCTGLTPGEVNERVIEELESKELFDSIVLLRLQGVLASGRISDIDFNRFAKIAEGRQAYKLLRNTSKLEQQEYREISVEKKPVQEIEKELIDANIGKHIELFDKDKEKRIINELMVILGSERGEEEAKTSYEDRVIESAMKKIDEELELPKDS